MPSTLRVVATTAVLAGFALASSVAAADDTIKRPGDHPQYAVEIEPHGLWGWAQYDYLGGDGLGLGARFSIPIVLQWNFFVGKHWSVFGEPGIVIYHSFFDPCADAPAGYVCGNPTATGVDLALYIGGRFHINDHLALVLRVGYPTFSFGVSFM